ncbi:MAG: exodeoxyribonuclease VII small subunit [Patescibacteria group bacterium]
MTDQKDKAFDFAKAIEELEEINRWFQNEEINLDEGLSKFRRGLELIKKSRGRLKEVENEFKEIKKEFSEEESQIEE